MSLEVETGVGSQTAESYVSVANCVLYAVAHGLSFDPGSPETAAEAALRRATAWIDANYRDRFTGRRRNGRNQALEWPRINASDVEGNDIAADEIPDEIIKATCESAVRELANPGALSPDVTPGQIIKQAAVTGAVSVTYASGSDVDSQIPVVTTIDNILGSLIGSRQGNATVSFLARA